MTMLVSTASMTSADFISDGIVEVFDVHVLAFGVQATEHVLWPGRRERTGGSEEHAVRSLLDDELLSRSPVLAVADRLRENDLPFGGDDRRRLFGVSHLALRFEVRRS